MEAAVPCDDRRPRRTSEWNEPGPKAKEWGAERPWSGQESRAGAGTWFNRKLSTPRFSQILCVCGFVLRPSPGTLFSWWTEGAGPIFVAGVQAGAGQVWPGEG